MFLMLKVKIIYICCTIFNIKTYQCISNFPFLYIFSNFFTKFRVFYVINSELLSFTVGFL